MRALKPDIKETIKKISPSFEMIFEQAITAESLGLAEICGVGYRKAFEFLVKDYLLSKALNLSTDEKIIKKTSLGVCIQTWFTDGRLKEVAKRASWLGNDETHYERIWVDKDLNDLKMLISLTINYIDSEIVADQYILAMPAA